MADRKSRSDPRRSSTRTVPQSPRSGRVRCAIYTRKSSDEGLEQEFNSLDAQREACEAYVRSQRHEGWQALPQVYDDPGYSGGNMEPALKRLLADIAARRIDVAVVYKVDRLTRSLADFAKIVEVFDANAVSFVSITQAFNTTTSMGRLSLNVLLSFAQFEREVTGERIRDKIAASKKKGLWMGGQPALGYDVKDRKLIVNEAEAETVRAIFRRYLDLGSVRELKSVLDAAGAVSKRRTAADGSVYGGQSFSRGALYQMLQNRVYRGEIVHKGDAYPGEHTPIVDEELWLAVQQKLEANGVERRSTRSCRRQEFLFAGVLFDAEGEPMTPTHANKKGVRYRYYVSRRLIVEAKSNAARGWRVAGQRLPAADLERLIVDRIRDFFSDPEAIVEALPTRRRDAPNRKRALAVATEVVQAIDASGAAKPVSLAVVAAPAVRAAVIDPAGPANRGDVAHAANAADFLRPLIARARVRSDCIDVDLRIDAVARMLLSRVDADGALVDDASGDAGSDPAVADDVIRLTIAAALRRVGKEMKFIVEGGSRNSPRDASLVRLLHRAHSLARRLAANPSSTLEDVGATENMGAPYAARLMRLNFLAPDIVVAILNGRQPITLTASKLMADTRLALDWPGQRKALGFA